MGTNKKLFKAILHEELDQVAEVVGLTSLATEDIGDYAGRMYDYHREHPDLLRLLRWESLTIDGEVPHEKYRRGHYTFKANAVRAGQEAGSVTDDIDAAYLVLFYSRYRGVVVGYAAGISHALRRTDRRGAPQTSCRRGGGSAEAREPTLQVE